MDQPATIPLNDQPANEETTSEKTAIRSGNRLQRRIGPVLLTLYGIGVMVGAGIYVLVGSVAGNAGVFAPLAFLAAGLIAAPTAISYSELSVRIPESAGEAAFVRRAFTSNRLSIVVGLAITGVGVTSAAAVLRGGVGYLQTFTNVNGNILIIAIGIGLVVIALWGAFESLAVAACFTVAEVAGLLLVSWTGITGPVSSDWAGADLSAIDLTGVGVATVLAFFAFIGFEDMVNMVEEVKRPQRTMPIAIVTSLIVTCALYGLVSVATVRTVAIDSLANSERPLALVYETATGNNPRFLSAIAVVAALNGVLAQVVMAARVLFGLGRTNQRLAIFHRADPRLGTPILATTLIGTLVIIGALTLDLEALAGATSTFLLSVFVIVNLSLLRLKTQRSSPGFSAPTWVPVLGLVGSLLALAVSAIW